MEPSLFLSLVQQYFPRLILAVTETINGEEENGIGYYFRRFLGFRYSLTGKWESIAVNGSRVMADVVAMDSSLPLKKRPSLSGAGGEIPKIGMEMALNETDLTNLQMMASSTLVPETQIIDLLFQDTATVIRGQYERLEHMFLQGLSTGAAVVTKDINVGTEIRVDYGFRTQNMFQTGVSWDNAAATPVTDLSAISVQSGLDGRPIRLFLMNQVSVNQILRSQEARDLYAEFVGAPDGSGFNPSLTRFNDAARERFGWAIEAVVRSTRYQIDGVDTDVQPWEAGQVVGINNENLGDVVWSFLAEMNAPVAGVTYQRADEFILASKYRVNRPSLKEFTSSQSRSLPVISAVDQIYHLDTTQNTGEPVGDVEGAGFAGRMSTASNGAEDDFLGEPEAKTTAKTAAKK